MIFGMITMCRCRLILVSKCTGMVNDLDNWGGTCVGVGDIWKVFITSFQLCCKSETPKKVNCKKKKKKSKTLVNHENVTELLIYVSYIKTQINSST